MALPDNPEALEQYFDMFEKNNKYYCFNKKDPEACHALGHFLEAQKKKYKEAQELYKANCFEREYGKSCTRYAEFLYDHLADENDYAKAYDVMLKGCQVKKFCPVACTSVASVLTGMLHTSDLKRFSKDENIQEGVRLFEKGCQGGDGIACENVALLYFKGKDSFKPDTEKALHYAKLACEFRKAKGCMIAAHLYMNGPESMRNENLHRFYQSRCQEYGGVRQTKRQNVPNKANVL